MISNSTPYKFLDPTLDVVFKLLLTGNADLLRDMIAAVLELSAPLRELEILNPEIPKDAPGDKSVVLDVRARLDNGHLIDLEMQSTAPEGTGARFLYYWAKNFVGSITKGDDYTLLRPCISILWFKVALLRAPRFHSKFVVCEPGSGEILSPTLEIHVLELPKLGLASAERQAKLERWARFLRATTIEELEALAREDVIMAVAKDALERLSADPAVRRMASDREAAVLMHRHLINASREAGKEEGRQEGRQEGSLLGKRGLVRRLLEAKFGAITPEAVTQLEAASEEVLERYAERVITASSVSEVLSD